jgi:signal recognition particle GTPase
MTKKKQQPKEATPTEPKQQPRQQQEQPKEQPKPAKQQPTQKAKPVVKRITLNYFERFNASNNSRKSWVKETIERATKEPVMVKNLSRGQIMALINQIDRYNMNTERKIVYKYDVKRGIVLLAPKDALLAKLRQQKEGEQ